MTAVDDRVLVLTYHSIAAAPGPTSIAAETFRMQLDELDRLGYRSLTVADFVAWRSAPAAAGGRKVLLTFDDGFADFAAAAHPLLREHGRSALVFLPTGRIGGSEDWAGAPQPGRRLLDWGAVRELAGAGIEFGAHGVTHADLTDLPVAARRAEIAACGRALAAELGVPTRCFAAPYGRVDRGVVADIAACYELSFGTRFGHARRDDPRCELPRIEMHYFRERRRWRDFLAGRHGYFHFRRALRGAGIAARGVLATVRG